LQGLYFLFCFVAVAIVIRWCMAADGKPGGEFKGLLAIKKESQSPPQAAKPRHGRFLPRR
jgi:hypothetical protein